MLHPLTQILTSSRRHTSWEAAVDSRVFIIHLDILRAPAAALRSYRRSRARESYMKHFPQPQKILNILQQFITQHICRHITQSVMQYNTVQYNTTTRHNTRKHDATHNTTQYNTHTHTPQYRYALCGDFGVTWRTVRVALGSLWDRFGGTLI